MTDDPRIGQLLEQLLDSDTTPEHVCESCPELLPIVRQRWETMRRLTADLDAIFPGADATAPQGPEEISLPQIPGYDVEAVLGRGGMGIVFRARHLRLDRPVAVKMLLAGAYAGPLERSRFQREAEAVARLEHPNVVQIYDVGDVDGRPYYTMELVVGGSLAQQLGRAPQPARAAAALVATLAQTMHVAHQRGIVHRDLKPANVLLTADGTPKITDFGLARRLEGEAGLTQSGVAVGTPSYMAPEQAEGHTHAVGPAVDVYALGAIFYELLTGRPPFRGDTAASTLQLVLTQDPVLPSRLVTAVPRDLETICLKCLQKAPKNRYATSRALAEDLARYERGEPILARPVSRAERVARWIRRKPAAAALIVMATALACLATAVAANEWRVQARRRAEIASWEPRFEQVTRLETEGDFQKARSILQRPLDVDVAALRDRISAGLAELDLAQNLDRIRLNRVAVVDGRFDLAANRARSDREYEAAFAAAGFGSFKDAASLVAAAVSASPVRAPLIAALDDWSVCTNDESRRKWILEVARTADPDPNGWRDRVREPALSKEALMELAETAVVRKQSVQLLVALAQRMQAAGADPAEFASRVQQEYPGDFWACFTLADALSGKNLEECTRYFQAALAIRPETAVAHFLVGRTLGQAGRAEEAIQHFREAVRLEPRFAIAVSGLGSLLSITGQGAEALELTKRAVALDGRSAYNHLSLAYVLNSLGQKEKALEEFRQAIALQPDNDFARHFLAATLIDLGRLDEAREQLEQFRRVRPNSAWLHFDLGQVLKGQERLDEAIAELNVAVRLDPQRWEPHSLLGDCWRLKESPQKALLEYTRALVLRPNDWTTLLARRAVLVQLGLGEEARAEWANALAAKPPNPVAWYGYAELCLYLGHQAEYERDCHELLGRFESGSEPAVCEQVARACLVGVVRAEERSRATALIERALRADLPPADTWRRPYFQIAQGLARYRLGDFRGAVAAIHGEALRVGGPFPHLVLSLAYARAGQRDLAVRSFATAIRMYDWRLSHIDNQDGWICHILRREVEPLVLPNLKALVAGQEKPRDQDERLALIAVCQSMQRTAMAVQLFVDAFAADPDLANRVDANYRYSAACCAARAGCGDGEDAGHLNERERGTLRERARTWLRDDLVAAKALLGRGPSPARTALPEKLEAWLLDPALARVRDDAELRKLPSGEQEAWRALWRDARTLLAGAKSADSKSSPNAGSGH